MYKYDYYNLETHNVETLYFDCKAERRDDVFVMTYTTANGAYVCHHVPHNELDAYANYYANGGFDDIAECLIEGGENW